MCASDILGDRQSCCRLQDAHNLVEYINEKVEALTKFDSRLGAVRATISLDGHQTTNEFNVRLDFVTSGKNVVINRKGTDVIAALNEAFDIAERSIKEEAAKLRQP